LIRPEHQLFSNAYRFSSLVEEIAMADSPYVVTVTEANFEEVVIAGSAQRPVLVDFWADWCAPCRQLMPILAKLADEFAAPSCSPRSTPRRNRPGGRLRYPQPADGAAVQGRPPVDQFMGALPEGQIRDFLWPSHRERGGPALRRGDARLAAGDLDAAAPLLETGPRGGPGQPEALPRGGAARAGAGRSPAPSRCWSARPSSSPRTRSSPSCAGGPPSPMQRRRSTGRGVRIAARHRPQADSEARYGLAAHQVLAGDYEAALDNLLTLMQRDRGYGDDAARKGILMIFDLLGDESESWPFRC
jgi:putative thioredoxin